MGINKSIPDKDKKGCFVVNTTTELIHGEKELLEIVQENKKIFERLFYNFLLKGQQSGEIAKSKNIKTISHLFYTLYSGIKVVSKIETNKKELTNSVNLALSLLV